MTATADLKILRRAPLDDASSPVGATSVVARRAVLVHGAMDRAASFTRLMAQLRDWSIVAYDRRGYAGSLEAGPPASFDEQVDDLLTVLDGEPAIAFGHSFGGDVVLATAAQHPELIPAALVWEAPQPWMAWWPSNSASRGAGEELEPEERAEWFMRHVVGDHVWDRLPSATRAKRRAEGPTLAAELRSLHLAPPFDAAAVRIPVIVGRGGRSRPHQRRGARELAATLPAGELVDIEDAQHGAHLSHPKQIAALLERVAAMAAR